MKLHHLVRTVILCLTVTTLASAATSLDGTWAGKCTAYTSQGQTEYVSQSWNFSGTNVTITEADSTKANCSSPAITSQIVGTYDSGAPSQSIEGATESEFVLNQVMLAFNDPMYAKAANSMSMCGYNDWAAGQMKDVTGKDCQGQTMPKAGEASYDVYKVDNNMLYMGLKTDQLDGSSPEKRPNQLDTANPLTKAALSIH